jgi:manganese-dependent inorganic pyrophosphatase
MQDITYIIGHKNPDVDSICSALAYEKYKELIGEKGFCAARCGNSNTRIDRVLEKFNAHLPKFVGDVRLRTGDVMKTDIIKMYADASCFSVMGAIDKHDLRSIPIIDENNKLLGEVSVFDLGEFFIPHPKSAKEVRRVTATLNDIVKTLNATTHCIFEAEKPEDMYVRIGAMEVSTFDSFIHKEQL